MPIFYSFRLIFEQNKDALNYLRHRRVSLDTGVLHSRGVSDDQFNWQGLRRLCGDAVDARQDRPCPHDAHRSARCSNGVAFKR